MPARKSLDHLHCSVANTAELIGDRWTVLILRDAFMGVRRFDDFQKDLGIARNILTDRLEMLVGSGILTTRQYEDRPRRFEYRLTEKGRDLYDVLVAMWRWGDRWQPPAEPHLRSLLHLDCGSTTHGVMRCENCEGELDTRNTRVEPPLAMVEERRLRSEA
jgi:DNA-binding HxlR family transcriptional regulator